MRKRGVMLLLAVLLGIVAGAGFLVWHPLGPAYHGKSLRAWLDAYGPGPGGYQPNPLADDALRHIGTNAVPYLLHLLQTTNSPAATASWPEKLAATLPASWNRWQAVQAVQAWVARYKQGHTPRPASWGHWQAYLAFQALGPLGKPALPELVSMAHDPRANSNPSGTGQAPVVRFWQDKKMVAVFAHQSSTYLAPDDSMLLGSWGRSVILVDGEIAAWSLAAIGPDSVPALTAMLGDPNPRLRCRAAVALGLMGGAAEPAVLALVKMLADPVVGYEAADALGCIGRRPELAVQALTAALADPNIGVKFLAMDSLGDFGEEATNAIPALLAFLPSGDHRLGESAVKALGKISPATTTQVVVPLLLRDFQNANAGIRLGALTSLCEMPDPKVVPVSVLQQALDDPEAGVRQEALWKLARLPDQRALAVPALLRAVDDSDDLLRNNAINFLGYMGSDARAAVPKLITLTNDPDMWRRQTAVRALQQIDPGRWPTNRP